MENYTIIQNADINSYLSDKAYRLYNLLQSICYADKVTCYPSEKYLSACLRCSVRTIQRNLKQLVESGLISVRRRGSTSNLYTLLQKKINQSIENVQQQLERAKQAYNKATEDKSKPNNYKKDYKTKESLFNQTCVAREESVEIYNKIELIEQETDTSILKKYMPQFFKE